MSKKISNEFASKLGLIAATVGSAVGLGNVWRFPAETQANGGAAFLLLYILCVLLLGVPVMLAEFSLGRAGRSDAVGVFRRLSPGTGWWIVGATAIVASYLILCFYMVVTGWTLEYMVASVTGDLYTTEAVTETYFRSRMTGYVTTTWWPLVATWAVIGINIAVLLGGVQKGIERLSNVLMPMLFVILVGLCCVTLTLPGAGEGLSYFLTPDFGKITPGVFINALGQAFFSLSLGMGILITYSSYYPADTRLGRTSVIVALLSLLVAVLMGVVIFPAVMSFGLDQATLEGTTLIFVTLPEVFQRMPLTVLWSGLFFVLLFVAALTSTVSISEVTVKFLVDRFGLSRRKAVLTALCPCLALSAVCSLSLGPVPQFSIMGMSFFDFLDNFATNILLPLVAMGVSLYVGWFAPKGMLRSQLTNEGTLKSRIAGLTRIVLRYIAPIFIALIMVFNLI